MSGDTEKATKPAPPPLISSTPRLPAFDTTPLLQTSPAGSSLAALGTAPIARAELRQMLGLPFLESTLSLAPASEIAMLDAWWHDHAGEFPFGKLHRWGRTYEPDACD